MRRFLKIVAILALFAIVIAYVAFRVLFFDPFGSARPALDPLIPKDVDLMVRRAELAKDFDPFPMPQFFKLLRLKDEWEALTRTRIYREVVPPLGIERWYTEAEGLPAQIQPLDLMQDLAGREMVVIGRAKPDGTFALAVLARGSFRTKLFAEAVRFGLARKAAGDVITAFSEKEGVRSVTVQGQTWHLFRTEDVVVAGNDFDLVKQVKDLADGGTGSLNESPQYRSTVLQPAPIGRPLDFVVDIAELGKRMGLAWPPAPEGSPLLWRFARELFAPDHFGQAIGRLQLGSQIGLLVRANADFVSLSGASGGLFSGQSGDLAQLHRTCGAIFPSKVAVTGYMKVGVKEFLRRVESLFDKDTRELLNDLIPQLKGDRDFQPKSIVELFDLFASCVADEFAFAIEPDEAYHIPQTPDNEMQFPDPHWGPRLAFVFPLAEKETAALFVDRMMKALQRRQTVVSNVWRWSYGSAGGDTFQEVKLLATDMPTISVGFLKLMERDCLVITTTGAFFDEIVQQKVHFANGANTGLQTEIQYKQAADAVSGNGQGFAFVSSPNLHRILSDLCVVFAENRTRPDYVKIRRDVESRLLSTRHREWIGKKLTNEQQETINKEVDPEMEKLDAKWRQETVPQMTKDLQADLGGLQMLRWAALTWRVNERDLELKLRLSTPASFP